MAFLSRRFQRVRKRQAAAVDAGPGPPADAAPRPHSQVPALVGGLLQRPPLQFAPLPRAAGCGSLCAGLPGPPWIEGAPCRTPARVRFACARALGEKHALMALTISRQTGIEKRLGVIDLPGAAGRTTNARAVMPFDGFGHLIALDGHPALPCIPWTRPDEPVSVTGNGLATPMQRHSGQDAQLLQQRKAVYEQAKQRHPQRWKGRNTRNCKRIDLVWLNPLPEEENTPKT
ncbi:hypothetical protein FQR65_LT20528 [Abscondita terminalis]|nr:hypothetical protein FQR65_LT20528 [Abscondita terminalis]